MVIIFVCLGFSVGFVMLVALFTLPTVMAPLVTECPYWAVKVIFNLDLWQLGHYCVVYLLHKGWIFSSFSVLFKACTF